MLNFELAMGPHQFLTIEGQTMALSFVIVGVNFPNR